MFDHWVCQWRSHSSGIHKPPLSWLNHKSYQCSRLCPGNQVMISGSEPDQRWNIIRVTARYSSFISSSLIHFFCFRMGLIRVSLSPGLWSDKFGAGAVSVPVPPIFVYTWVNNASLLWGWTSKVGLSCSLILLGLTHLTPGPSSSAIQELPREPKTLPYHSPRNVPRSPSPLSFWEKGLSNYNKNEEFVLTQNENTGDPCSMTVRNFKVKQTGTLPNAGCMPLTPVLFPRSSSLITRQTQAVCLLKVITASFSFISIRESQAVRPAQLSKARAQGCLVWSQCLEGGGRDSSVNFRAVLCCPGCWQS